MKKLKKDVYGFTGASLTMGLGTAVVAKAGGSTAGMSTMSSMMPIVSTLTMGKHALRMTKKLRRKK